jgi:cytochrome c oxidase assembly protein subunit 15
LRIWNLPLPSTPFNRAHHRFAVFMACATFLLIVAGALVTSNDAGLSVPDWPTTFGSLVRIPRMVGGVKFEHGHRMTAEFIGFLTIILAVWTWRTDRRAWMRRLGVGALATVILQGVMGGLTVLTFLPPMVSSAHALLGQTFFALAVAIALFTGSGWVGSEPQPRFDTHRPALPALAWGLVAAIYLQLFLGAMFRHHGMSILPHLIMAGGVTILVLWTVVRVLTRHSQVAPLRRPAVLLLGLLIAQLALGFTAYLTRVVWNPYDSPPVPPMVISTVAHVSVGALLLVTAVVLAIQATRYVSAAAMENPAGTREAATA